MITPNDALNSAQLVNRTEFSRMTANHSGVNRICLSDGYAVVGSAEPPINLDFQATSFGSEISCRVVTGLCGAVSTVGAREPYPALFNFVCNASTAGLNMTVNFFNALALLNSSDFTTGPSMTNGSPGNGSHIIPWGGGTPSLGTASQPALSTSMNHRSRNRLLNRTRITA